MPKKPKHKHRELCYRTQRKYTKPKDISNSWEKLLLEKLKKQK